MNLIFKQEHIAKEFSNEGYIQLPNVPVRLIEKCKELFLHHFGELPDGMYISHYENDLAKNIRVSEALLDLFQPWLNEVFIDYKFILGHFISKSHKNSSEFRLHQDWSVVEEESEPFVHIWVPLHDTSKENGGLYVLPKSHRFFGNKRSGSLNIPFVDINEDLKPHIKNLSVARGEAILYHPALFHGSLPNLSQQPRNTVLLTLTSKEAILKYFHQNEEGQIDSYYVKTEELLGNLKHLANGGSPINYTTKESLEVSNSLDNDSIDNDILLMKLGANE